ncbi:MBL fold metallo-hydrolase [Aureimonas altamirensis]|uniref:MBL fold metallo-hydrolase n=1 Tax=Aureimonas altamirensis TaxID=370622 RepID=UPI001E5FF63A|nr:MBL fold metallo-hydrolase [Aureimonas altamirensis]UHD47373.1 MBL fold metallo-hydrolase [Aureimonas altamirensis]
MADELDFRTDFRPVVSAAEEVAPDILRIVAPNAGAMTFRGTNSYVLGRGSVVVVDPGPDDGAHLDALLRAIGNRPVEAILITHTHLDHTALAPRLAEETGAPIWAEGPHRHERALAAGEENHLDAAADKTLPIARTITDGETLPVDAMRIEAVTTPGHAANHLSFALPDQSVLLSGDHVMGWATSLVAPPDGAMGPYLASLEKLMHRHEALYLPGHGDRILDPQKFLRGLRAHRLMRERAILERLSDGNTSIASIVASIYRNIDPRLVGAAALNVLSHLEFLEQKGLARSNGPVGPGARWMATPPQPRSAPSPSHSPAGPGKPR